MESIFPWFVAAGIVALTGYLWVWIQARADNRIKKYAEELSRSRASERELASLLATERAARIEAEAIAIAIRQERERAALDPANVAHIETESAAHNGKVEQAMADILARLDGSALPEMFARMTERTATLVLMRLPENADRDLMAMAASLGGLMTAHSYIAAALEAHLRKIDDAGGIGDAPLYGVERTVDAPEDDEEKATLDDDEVPPSSGSIN